MISAAGFENNNSSIHLCVFICFLAACFSGKPLSGFQAAISSVSSILLIGVLFLCLSFFLDFSPVQINVCQCIEGKILINKSKNKLFNYYVF